MDSFINRMLDNYHENIIQENKFEWFKNDERACFLVFLVLLINEAEYDDLPIIEKNNFLNLSSGSLLFYHCLV
ncbi:hypothetical protein J4727_04995 [Providencia rettgeri]|uniref:Uncharacterized protein n=1 Tax=Providencia rettgeri TaxID=587 RepID=A0A939SNZ2_PRORE|nr:hypothetical protein [Providencia rettgeri]